MDTFERMHDRSTARDDSARGASEPAGESNHESFAALIAEPEMEPLAAVVAQAEADGFDARSRERATTRPGRRACSA
jgi:hypothetical protein